jgi:ABC-type nitrate/sulfonate/bicarbonate transport system substrate-binding protein
VKKISTISVVFAILVLAVNFVLSTSTPSSADDNLVTIRMGNTAVKLERVYELLGLEKGIYKKYGIDLQIINFISGGSEAAAATVSGQLDMGCYGTPILILLSRGGALKIIGAPANKNLDYELFATSDIKTVEELKGKTVAVGAPGTGGHQQFLRIITAHGLSQDDLEILGSGGSDPALLLSSGRIQAVITRSDVSAKLESEGIGHVLASSKDYYDTYQHSYIYATDAFIKEHPDTIVNYLKALRESYDYSRTHLEELVAKGAEIMNMNEKAVRNFFEKDFERWDLSLSLSDEGIENAIAFLKSIGDIEDTVKFDKATWVDGSFLRKANLPPAR